MRRRLSTLLFLVLLALPPGPASAERTLETLPYRLSLGNLMDVAQAVLTFKELEPGRYLAEFSGGATGVWQLLNRWLPERYRTEMILRDGRLKPLVYREEIHIRGSRWVKEYRFDYDQGRLEYWRQTETEEMHRRWRIPLPEQLYDCLSLFYNLRMGTFGPLDSLDLLRVGTIPAPDPEEIVLRMGRERGQRREVMLKVHKNSGEDEGPYFLEVGPDGVPRQAWFRVSVFGKLTGRLLDESAILPRERLPGDKSGMGGGAGKTGK